MARPRPTAGPPCSPRAQGEPPPPRAPNSRRGSLLARSPGPRFQPSYNQLADKFVLSGGLVSASSVPGQLKVDPGTWFLQHSAGRPPTWLPLAADGAVPVTVGAASALLPEKFNSTSLKFEAAPTLSIWAGYNERGPDDVPLHMLPLGCPVGFVSPNISIAACSRCMRGTYAGAPGQTECTPCPRGTTTPGAGSTERSNCSLCGRNACSGHGTCSVQAGTPACGCSFLWNDGGDCSQLQHASLAIVAAVAVFLGAIVSIVALSVRNRVMRLRNQSSQYQELVAEREGAINELERGWLIHPEEIELGSLIAEGSFGEVHAVCRPGGGCRLRRASCRLPQARYSSFHVAVKMLRKATRDFDLALQEDGLRKEIGLLKTLRHPNIMFFFGAGIWSDELPFFVTELCGRGSLRKLLDDVSVPLSVSRSITFALGAARGMAFLHGRSPARVHRDLKADNLLVADDGDTVKVADFGCARLLTGQRAYSDSAWVVLERPLQSEVAMVPGDRLFLPPSMSGADMTSAVGTLLWMAPEVLDVYADGEMTGMYGPPADVYSFGIVMNEILTRAMPYADVREIDEMGAFTVGGVRKLIMDGLRPSVPRQSGFPPGYIRTMEAAWQQQPEARPDFASLVVDISAHLPGGEQLPF